MRRLHATPATLAVVLVAFGCASEPRRNATANGAGPPSADGGPDAAAPNVPVPGLDAIAAEATRGIAGMREIARLDRLEGRSPVVVADAGAGTCVRARFAASRPVEVALVDREGTTHGDSARGLEGLVPPLGPACFTGGEGPQLVVKGAPERTLVRAVVLASP